MQTSENRTTEIRKSQGPGVLLHLERCFRNVYLVICKYQYHINLNMEYVISILNGIYKALQEAWVCRAP